MKIEFIRNIALCSMLVTLLLVRSGMGQTHDPRMQPGFPKGFTMGSVLSQDATALNEDKDRIRKSKIKSKTIWEYDASGKGSGEIVESSGVKLSTYAYDTEGNIVEQIAFATDGSILEKITVEYDTSGYVTESTIYSNLQTVNRIVNQQVVYEYDNDNRIRAISTVDLEGTMDLKIEYTYDDSGRVAEGFMFGLNGLMNVRADYTYDDEGRLIEMIAYDNTKGTVTVKSEIVYTADGWEVVGYGPAGEIMNRTKNMYDGNGNVHEVILYDANDRVLSRTENTYDSEGRLIEKIDTMPAAGMSTRSAVTYDDKGNVSEEIIYNKLDEPVKITKYVYEYYE